MLSRFAPHTYALLRIVAGLMFALHGTQKILGWPPSDRSGTLSPLMLVGGLIELVGGLLIAVGLFTALAAFVASGEMAVAYFMAHAPHGFLPLQNKGELAVVYCFLWLFVAAEGGGIWSIDSIIRGRRAATA